MADEKKKALESFANCAALYQHFRRGDLKVKRAQLHGNNVLCDPLDFTIDFELKTKKTLGNGADYEMALRLCNTEDQLRVPEVTRQKLAKNI